MSLRTYNQVARAESTQRTRQAILAATKDAFRDHESFDPSLDLVAERAGVTTRTLLRHFGSKQGLMAAAIADEEAAVMRSREAEPGDVDTAVSRLVDHYEERGDEVVALLAAAERHSAARRVTERGKNLHRRWVERVFAPDLAPLPEGQRRRRLALVASVTDVYLWALLRRRHGLSRQATQSAIRGLVEHARGAER